MSLRLDQPDARHPLHLLPCRRNAADGGGTDRALQHAAAFKDKVPNGFDYELKRLYYEIANAAYSPSMAAITNMVPTSQIMFGTDFPMVAIDDTANGLRNLGLAPTDVLAIARGNAIGLFPRLQG